MSRRHTNTLFVLPLMVLLGCSLCLVLAACGKTELSPAESQTHETLVTMPASSKDMVNHPYEEVVELLEDAGFTNVLVQPHRDLVVELIHGEGDVEQVTINGEDDVAEGTKLQANTQILVIYHAYPEDATEVVDENGSSAGTDAVLSKAPDSSALKDPVQTPFSSKILCGGGYEDAVRALQEAGFTNVKAEPKEDLLVGISHEEGDVLSISINGVTEFDKGWSFERDAPIIVEYHAFSQ
ncbi:MAG: PASTA domain-containing protein [Atopobiaceae bacterium]|nr:PASTA domain-containing protein [Atopobiaceae bacterium]